MRLFYIFTLVVLVSSCATILNRPTKTVTIQLNEPKTIVVNRIDTLPKNLEFKYKTFRGRDTLHISILDTLKNTSLHYEVYPEFSNTVFSNFYLGYGLFTLIDVKYDKAYTYPNYIYLNTSDTSFFKIKKCVVYTNSWFPKFEKIKQRYHSYQKTYHKDLFLKVGTSLFNWQSSVDLLNYEDISFSAFDLNLGVDYYYHPSRFVSIDLFQNFRAFYQNDTYTNSFPLVSKSFIKSITPYIYSSQLANSTATMFNIQHKHQLKNWIFGYGISFSYVQHLRAIEYNFTPKDYSNLTDVSYKDIRLNVSPILSTHFIAGRFLTLGASYIPINYTINSSSGIQNEHFISLDMTYRFKLNKVPKFISSEIKE
jgi:hypothetical protein